MRAINRNYYLVLLGLSDKYQWVEDPKPFDAAREHCQSLGDGWDMAIVMNRLQLDLLTDLGDQWMGFQRNGQETKTIFDKPTFWAGMKYDKKETYAHDCISLNAGSRRILTQNCEVPQVGFQLLTRNRSLISQYTNYINWKPLISHLCAKSILYLISVLRVMILVMQSMKGIQTIKYSAPKKKIKQRLKKLASILAKIGIWLF